MDINTIVGLIGTLGFPIVACGVMAYFIFKIYKNTTAENAANMAAVQARCAEREEKLYNEIDECRKINAQAIATLTLYAERLGCIEEDLREVKTEVTKICNKLEN